VALAYHIGIFYITVTGIFHHKIDVTMRIWGYLHKRWFQWMTCLFILALFTDAANIPDIFVDQTVIVDHDDEDAPVSSSLDQTQSSLLSTSNNQIIDDGSVVKKSPRVIYDVDSPSLQAGVAHSTVSIQAHSNKCGIHLLSPFFIENLYLRNSSLLI
jgi:hypothetical protein